MRSAVYAFMAGAALLAAAPASADPAPVTLDRAGKWQVDYDTDSCHLQAQFGTGDDAVALSFTRYEPGDEFELRLYGRPLKNSGQLLDTSVDFGLGAPRQAKALIGTSRGLPMLILGSHRLDGWRAAQPGMVGRAISAKQEALVTQASFILPGQRRYVLRFGPIDGAMAALRLCTADLVKSWGYDPAAMAALAARPQPLTRPGTWLHSDDYPTQQLRTGGNGLVQFRLDVDAAGAVAGCHVLNTTGAPDFAAATCKALRKRARFAPARDAGGQPVAAFFVETVRWLAWD